MSEQINQVNPETGNIPQGSEEITPDNQPKVKAKVECGMNYEVIRNGMLQSVPAEVRYKVVKLYEEVLQSTLPTIQALLAGNKTGYVVIDDIPYPISSYVGPTFVQRLLDASLAYVDETAKKRAAEIVHVTEIPDAEFPGMENQRVLNPEEFADQWDKLSTSKSRIPVTQYKRGCSSLMDYTSFLTSEGVTFFNTSGCICEEVVSLLDITLPFDKRYFVSTKTVSNMEVEAWIARQFSATSVRDVVQSTTTPVQAEA